MWKTLAIADPKLQSLTHSFITYFYKRSKCNYQKNESVGLSGGYCKFIEGQVDSLSWIYMESGGKYENVLMRLSIPEVSFFLNVQAIQGRMTIIALPGTLISLHTCYGQVQQQGSCTPNAF